MRGGHQKPWGPMPGEKMLAPPSQIACEGEQQENAHRGADPRRERRAPPPQTVGRQAGSGHNVGSKDSSKGAPTRSGQQDTTESNPLVLSP